MMRRGGAVPERLMLLLVVLGAVLAAVLFATVSPDGRAPDEYRYVEDIVRFAGGGGMTTVTGHPPLYPAIGSLVYRMLPAGDLWHYILRLLGSLTAGVAVVAAYWTSRELFPDRPIARWLPPLLIAFLPQFAFVAGSVNSDGLLAAECALLFYVCVVVTRRGLTLRTLGWLVLLTALGVLTKQRFLVLVPVELLVLVVAAVRAFTSRRSQKGAEGPVGGRLALVVAGTAVALFAGLGFLQLQLPFELRRLGEVLSPAASAEVLARPYFLLDLFTSFWGYFDWLVLPMHPAAYAFYLALTVSGLGGLVLMLVRAAARSGVGAALRLPSASTWLLVLGTQLLSLYAVVLYQVGGLAAQGRYLFIAIVPFAIALGAGVDALIPRRYARVALASTSVALAAVLFAEVALCVMPYYY